MQKSYGWDYVVPVCPVSPVSSLCLGKELKVGVMRIQIAASLSPQREQRVKTESWSPPSPEGTRVEFDDRYLEKHITPITLKSNIKRNPLYMDMRSMEAADNKKSKPSWTVKEYDTQTVHGNLAGYLKVKCGEEESCG